jgi:hypothetical protein
VVNLDIVAGQAPQAAAAGQIIAWHAGFHGVDLQFVLSNAGLQKGRGMGG